jgi:hypothetical protein
VRFTVFTEVEIGASEQVLTPFFFFLSLCIVLLVKPAATEEELHEVTEGSNLDMKKMLPGYHNENTKKIMHDVEEQHENILAIEKAIIVRIIIACCVTKVEARLLIRNMLFVCLLKKSSVNRRNCTSCLWICLCSSRRRVKRLRKSRRTLTPPRMLCFKGWRRYETQIRLGNGDER